MAIKSSYWIAFSLLIAIVVKHLYGVSFVSKLVLSVVSYIIVLFVYLSSTIWHHLLLIFHTSLLDIWRSERDCRLNIYSVGWTHYSVGCTLYSVGCICSVGCTHYSVGWAQCITDPSVANIYSVGCAQCSVSCKHILCRLYTLLGSLTFSGNVLKNKLDKKLYDNNIRCLDRLRWVPSIATSLTRKRSIPNTWDLQ